MVSDASYAGFYRAATTVVFGVAGLLSFGNVLLPRFVKIKNKDFWKLNGENKILRYLAAISGRQFLELQEPEVSLNNAQISKGLNININSVRGFLSNLRSQGFIETEGGKNKITTQGLHDLLEGRRDSDGS